jgi:hypothetical protein
LDAICDRQNPIYPLPAMSVVGYEAHYERSGGRSEKFQWSVKKGGRAGLPQSDHQRPDAHLLGSFVSKKCLRHNRT